MENKLVCSGVVVCCFEDENEIEEAMIIDGDEVMVEEGSISRGGVTCVAWCR